MTSSIRCSFEGSTIGMTSREIRRASKRNKNPENLITILGVKYKIVNLGVSKSLNNLNGFVDKLKK